MGIESEKERDEEVVGVPKCFIGLLADSNVGGGVHHEHTEEHDMARDAPGLGVVYLYCCLGSYLVSFNIKEAIYVNRAQSMNALGYSLDVVRANMNAGPEEQRVSNLSVKPLRLIQR